MKNILLISHGELEYDGRLRELVKIFGSIGNLSFITRGDKPIKKNQIVCSKSSYLKFILEAVKTGKEKKKIDILVLDNRKSIIPGLILRKILRPDVTIIDCRELYIKKEVKHIAGKIGCLIERKGIETADVIICANEFRSKKMMELYSLDEKPLVYENLRKLEYGSDEEVALASDKLFKYINEDEFRIVTTSGCLLSRTNDILVKNLDKITQKTRLLMVGDSPAEDENAIKKIISTKELTNVDIIGKLNQTELKYLITHSHIGIVNYNQNDLNNKYCASGKLYEFIYEGIPVVTTTNPPLKALCDDQHIGIADDEYYNGLNQIIERYDDYKSCVESFASQKTVETNNNALINELIEIIQAKTEGE